MSKKAAEPLTPSVCRLSRLSTQFVGKEMTRIGFGPGQFFLLSELFIKEGQSQDELSRKVGVDKSNTSRALARLEKYSLIQRTASPDNHKEKRVYLTDKAIEIEPVFRNIQKKWNSTLLEGFSEEEKQFLASALSRMIENARAVIQKKPLTQTQQQGE